MKKVTPKSPFHRSWSAAGLAMLVIIFVPLFANAVNGQSVSDGTPTGNQTAALISALSNLESRVADLATAYQNSRNGSLGTTADQTALADGMPQCLQSCRTALGSCLRSSGTASTSSPTARVSPSLATGATTGLDACRSRANDCINKCRPTPPPVVSCEDRCAVALGGCLLGAGTDATKLKDCRVQNQRCLIAACVGGAPSSATRVPSQICRDQCARDRAICQRAARFDTTALRGCDTTAQICLQQVCLTTDAAAPQTNTLLTPGVVAPSTSPTQGATAGQQVTINCENACTQTFNSCTTNAAGDAGIQQGCNTSYGDCRNQCLTLIGGGM